MPYKRRVQVPKPQVAPALEPKASPVDIFHQSLQMPPVQGNDAGDLAAALGSLKPSLTRYADMKVKDDVAAGEKSHALQVAREANRAEFKAAVDAGQMPAGASPWFQKGWNRQQMRVAGLAHDEALRVAWMQSSAKGSGDPAEFETFLQDFSQKYVKDRGLEQNREFGSVFLPQMEQSQANLAAIHTANRQAEVEQQVKDNTYKEVQSILDHHLIYGDDAAGYRAIESTLQDQVMNGLDGSDANKLAIDAITDRAISEGDLDGLNVLDAINTGNGPLGKIQYARDKRLAAETNIINSNFSLQARQASMEKAQRAQMASAIHTQAIEQIEADPLTDLQPLILQMAQVDPKQADDIRAYQNKKLSSDVRVFEDPQVLATIYEDLHNGTLTHADITRYAAQGLVGSSIANLSKSLSIYNSHSQELRSSAFTFVRAGMIKNMAGDPLFPNFNADNVTNTTAGDRQFAMGWLNWRASEAGAKASDEVATKWLIDYSLNIEAVYGTVDPYATRAGLQDALEEHNASGGEGRLAKDAKKAGLTPQQFIKQKQQFAK